MKFKPYNKIHALHKEECKNILEGTCYIQEKVDGANASIFLGDDGEIHYGSRSRDLFLANDMANHLAKNGADFNFKKFRELCNKKSKSIFMELLTGDVSVANL